MADKNSRIDKFLWAVRVFKTRAQAAEACKKGKIVINDIPVKPSRTVAEGETLFVRKPPVVYTYKIKSIPKGRLSAKLVPDYIDDLTSQEELDKTKVQETFFVKRDRGTGRPTKKERRTIDKLKDNI